MSVIVELSIFPIDKGASLSVYVARALRIIKESGLPYNLGPMGTCIEGEWSEVMDVVTNCLEELKKDSSRISINLKVDYQEGKTGRMESKILSVKKKL